jgi:digeranylgeranylglycerophospholipid reductase
MSGITVVGGGPAGSMSAYYLASSGRDVTVIEEHRESGKPVHCAGMLTPETVRMSGVSPDVLGSANSADVIFPGGRVLTIGRRAPMVYFIDRADLDRRMAEKAADSGAEFRYGVQCKKVEVNHDYALVQTNQGDIRSDIVVGADGANSCVSDSIPGNEPKEIINGAQYDLDFKMEDQNRMVLRIGSEVAPGFFSWQIPMGETTRLGLCVGDGKNPSVYLKHLMKISGLEDCKITARYGGSIPIGGRKTSYSDRIMLVGDAAGQIKPVSGGGLNPLFRAAPFIMDAVDRAYELDMYTASVMSLYEHGWRKELGKELKRGDRMRKYFLRFSDRQMDQVGEMFDTPAIREKLGMIDFDDPSGVVRPILAEKGVKLGFMRITHRGKKQ